MNVNWLTGVKSIANYCDVYSCLNFHSDGTHSFMRIYWWASDLMLNSQMNPLWWRNIFQLIVTFRWTIPLNLFCLCLELLYFIDRPKQTNLLTVCLKSKLLKINTFLFVFGDRVFWVWVILLHLQGLLQWMEALRTDENQIAKHNYKDHSSQHTNTCCTCADINTIHTHANLKGPWHNSLVHKEEDQES